jgi:hypothetical protein
MSRKYDEARKALAAMGYSIRGQGGGGKPGILARSKAWRYRITRTENGWHVEPVNSSKNYRKLMEALNEEHHRATEWHPD